ncbi:hypothetical protein [Methanobacterium sp. MBAC-LM]|uniref:hypothetical protein n=1 Tax=Methanobacterium sp. MBAC-LM TaxID=3412034 RepID=UPI003C741F8B
MANGNSGLKEEIEVANYFTNLGYFTRFHIQIYPDGDRGQVSDIDVFTIKFDNLLLATRNIIETKRSIDKVSALFQLYGFRKYYEDSNIFFVNKKANSRNFNVANKLNIKAYSFSRLKDLNKKSQRYNRHRNLTLELSDGEQIIKYLDEIKNIEDSLYWSYHYLWVEKNPFRKLNDIQEIFGITDDIYDKYQDDKAFLWFRKELFLMAFLSVIEISSKCIALDNFDINEYVKEQYYNLGTSKRRKMEIKEGIDSLLELLKEQYENIELKSIDLIPPWINLLIKIVKKIIMNANYANRFLLINENIHKSHIIGKPRYISTLTLNRFENKVLSSINIDLLRILHKEQILKDFNHFI